MKAKTNPEHPGDPSIPLTTYLASLNRFNKFMRHGGNRIACVKVQKMNNRGGGMAWAVLCIGREPIRTGPMQVCNISGCVSDLTGLPWKNQGAVGAGNAYQIRLLLEERVGHSLGFSEI